MYDDDDLRQQFESKSMILTLLYIIVGTNDNISRGDANRFVFTSASNCNCVANPLE